jgi:hypothetical protein
MFDGGGKPCSIGRPGTPTLKRVSFYSEQLPPTGCVRTYSVCHETLVWSRLS